MSAAPKSTLNNAQPVDDQEPLSSKSPCWRQLFSDRLLWTALGLSFIAHFLVLAPRYGIKLPEHSDKSLAVSFRTVGQSDSKANKGASHETPAPLGQRKTTRTEVIKATSSALSNTSVISGANSLSSRSTNLAPPLASNNSTAASRVGTGRRVTLTNSMKDYRYSQYLSDWRNKVERIGAMNYPEEARGKFFGSLVLSVALRPDGNVDRIIVVRSSGNKVLDDAAKRIVMIASPFAPFPPDIRKETDYLDITRTWNFTRGDALETR